MPVARATAPCWVTRAGHRGRGQLSRLQVAGWALLCSQLPRLGTGCWAQRPGLHKKDNFSILLARPKTYSPPPPDALAEKCGGQSFIQAPFVLFSYSLMRPDGSTPGRNRRSIELQHPISWPFRELLLRTSCNRVYKCSMLVAIAVVFSLSPSQVSCKGSAKEEPETAAVTATSLEALFSCPIATHQLEICTCPRANVFVEPCFLPFSKSKEWGQI